MAENVLLKEQLTERMVEAGARLTEKLDEIGFPFTAAFWWFDSEINEWRLRIASPEAKNGTLALYRRIDEILTELGPQVTPINSLAISVVQDDSRLVQGLRNRLHTGSAIERIRLKGSAVEGRYIEDALVYRAA